MLSYNISLVDVVQLVRQSYQQYVTAALAANNVDVLSRIPNQSWNIDHLPFMEALAVEVFNPSGGDIFGQLKPSPSVSALMRCGMDQTTASYVAQLAFQLFIDTISAHIPHIEFGDNVQFTYGLCDIYDIVVTDHRQ